MPQSLAQIYLHIVFSTKERRPFLEDHTIREELHNYLGGTCTNLGFMDEFRRLLKKYGLEWDERYVWD
jgi:REP element-mobilizing transposase RayT